MSEVPIRYPLTSFCHLDTVHATLACRFSVAQCAARHAEITNAYVQVLTILKYLR